jgi:hypothetical protein
MRSLVTDNRYHGQDGNDSFRNGPRFDRRIASKQVIVPFLQWKIGCATGTQLTERRVAPREFA